MVVVTEGCGELGDIWRICEFILKLAFPFIYPFPPKPTTLVYHLTPGLTRSEVRLFHTNLTDFRVPNLDDKSAYSINLSRLLSIPL